MEENKNNEKSTQGKLRGRIIISIYESGTTISVKKELGEDVISHNEVVSTIEIAKHAYIYQNVISKINPPKS